MRNDQLGERLFRLRMSVWNAFRGAARSQLRVLVVCVFSVFAHVAASSTAELALRSGVASVNRQYRAGDEARRLGTKEHDDSGNVSRISPPLLRRTLEDLGGSRLVRHQ